MNLPELISGFLEGTLSPAEREELNAILRADAGARARFARAMRQETLVGEVLRDATSAVAEKPVTRRRSARRFRAMGGPRTAVPWLVAAAAALLIGIVVFVASRPAPSAPPIVRKIDPPAVENQPAPVPQPEPKPVPAPAPKPEPLPEKPPPAPAPQPLPVPPVPTPKPEVPPVKPPTPAPSTVAYVATVKSVEGDVPRVKAGDGIVAGQGLETADGRAVVVYPDGTRMELGAATKVRAFAANRIDLLQGTLGADIAKQSRAMVLATPHAEVRVLGTALRVVVAAATRVEVREGKVRLIRAADGKGVDVAAGAYAGSADLKTRPLPTVNDPSLIGHWKFDEGRGQVLMDSSFGANDGAAAGGTWTPGRLGAALRFDGVNDLAVVQGRFPFPKNALTVAAWVRHESLPAKVQRYVVVRSDVDLMVLRHDGADSPRQLNFFITAGNAMRHLRADDALAVGAWIHVAGTWDGQVQRLYVNGAEIAQQNVGGALGAREGSSILIGVPREPMHGALDDLRLYNRALSDKEIADLAR